MTLVSSIIQKAYRASNLIPIGATPTTAQTTEALDHYNNLLLSTVGNEAGDDLNDLTVSGTQYDQSTALENWIPDNVRLLLSLSAAKTYNLDPNPEDGQRVAIVDIGSNLATYNLTLNGNGRLIEDAASIVLNTDDTIRQWMYRADLGEWVRLETLADDDTHPFPDEFNDYFILMLALRLNPSYGQSLAPESLKMLARAKTLLHSRYCQVDEILPDVDWRSVPSQLRRLGYSFGDEFSTGRPYRWR